MADILWSYWNCVHFLAHNALSGRVARRTGWWRSHSSDCGGVFLETSQACLCELLVASELLLQLHSMQVLPMTERCWVDDVEATVGRTGLIPSSCSRYGIHGYGGLAGAVQLARRSCCPLRVHHAFKLKASWHCVHLSACPCEVEMSPVGHDALCHAHITLCKERRLLIKVSSKWLRCKHFDRSLSGWVED